MTIYFCLFTVVFVLGSFGLPAAWSKKLPEGSYLSRDVTAAINGYFISIVFLSHLKSYIDANDFAVTDQGYLVVIKYLGQLVVATFLFYSGYGIMESITRKPPQYIYDLPRKRILPFLLDFWIALLAFMVGRAISGRDPVYLDRILLAMVGWKNLGNSDWYIFAILNLWIFTYLSFRFFPRKDNRWAAILMTFVFALGYCFMMRREGVGKFYYNTVLCYPAGMTLSYILGLLRRRGIQFKSHLALGIVGTAILLPLFLFLHRHALSRAILFNVMAIVFALLVSACSLLTTHASKPFIWAGNNLFYLFIYQRLPMMLLKPWLRTNAFLYATASLAALIPLCLVMTRVHAKVKGFLLASPPSQNS